MPRLDDPEPIEINGKVLYENELDRVKRMYGFLPPTPYGQDLDPEERARRQWARQRNKINRAK
jgi:hypothetical protein